MGGALEWDLKREKKEVGLKKRLAAKENNQKVLCKKALGYIVGVKVIESLYVLVRRNWSLRHLAWQSLVCACDGKVCGGDVTKGHHRP